MTRPVAALPVHRASRTRAMRALLLATAGLICVPGVAFAADVSVANGVLLYDGGVSAQNVTISKASTGKYSVVESSSIITTGSGCTRVSSGHVECTSSGVGRITVDLGGNDDKVTILSGVTVPTRLLGGPGNDTLVGGSSDDVLEGGDGNDDMSGGPGGFDTVSYASGCCDLDVFIDNQANDGHGTEADNVRTSIEKLIGSPQDDTLIGSDGANEIDGGLGRDTIKGKGGDDLLDGGDDGDVANGSDFIEGDGGFDTVTYARRTAAVKIVKDNVANDGARQGSEGDDVRGDIEKFVGGSGNDQITAGNDPDVIVGGPGDDQLFGLAGNDVLDGGPGHDILDGGNDVAFDPGVLNSGSDTITYESSQQGVTVTFSGLGNGTAQPDGDQITRVENVTGSPQTDDITGDDGPNRINGLGGADTLKGAGGDDTMNGNDGIADTIGCGGGADTAVIDLKDTFLGAGCENQEVAPVHQHPNVRISQSLPKLGADGVLRVRLYCPRALRHGCGGTLQARAFKDFDDTVLLATRGYKLGRRQGKVIGIPLSRSDQAALRAAPGHRLKLIARERDFKGRSKKTIATRQAFV